MHNKSLYLFLFLLVTIEIVIGKNENISKTSFKTIPKKLDKSISRVGEGRGKRSVIANEKPFRIPNTAHELDSGSSDIFLKHPIEENGESSLRNIGVRDIESEPPFWGTRGRRDSSSESSEFDSFYDEGYPDVKCKSCGKILHDFNRNKIREELDPFWGNRGKKDTDDISEYDSFWGNRERREDESPFWGNRGRRSKMKWKYHDDAEPFWGNRGRRDEMEPFWGNRGRRDENEPFWGNRGKRQEDEPFWGTRGRREIMTKNHNFPLENNRKIDFNAEDGFPFWSRQARKKMALKENIINSLNRIEYDVENLSRMRRSDQNSFWKNRGRENTLKSLFNYARDKMNTVVFRPSEQNTVLDDRMYAEQPHYILIERSSRSAEEDPYFISRGKKYIDVKFPKTVRDRRGVLEELVKSVRNDPYYIARGKKDSEYITIGNSTILKDEFSKAKELVCSAIDLLVIKEDGHKDKRDTEESERERRTTLKKLAAQLQLDPYFVSRGKKSKDMDRKSIQDEERLEEFINQVSGMCN